jgi:hypothetical protein
LNFATTSSSYWALEVAAVVVAARGVLSLGGVIAIWLSLAAGVADTMTVLVDVRPF